MKRITKKINVKVIMQLMILSINISFGLANTFGIILDNESGIGSESGESIQQTPDGGYIILGNYSMSPWLIKLDQYGNQEWEQFIIDEIEVASSLKVKILSTGEYIVLVVKSQNQQSLLIKISQFGDILWQNQINYMCTDIQFTNDGYYLSCGVGNLENNNLYNIGLVNLDSDGNEQWTRIFEYEDSNIAVPYSLSLSLDGGFILTGMKSYDCIDIEGVDTCIADLFVIKTDLLGNQNFSIELGFPNYLEAGYSIEQTEDNGYIISGMKSESLGNNNRNLWLLKLDQYGVLEWEYTSNNEADSNNSVGLSLIIDDDGGYVVAGKISDKPRYIKFDSNGNIDWVKPYSEFEGVFKSIIKTNDGAYALTGSFNDHVSGPISINEDLVILKTNQNGDLDYGCHIQNACNFTYDDLTLQFVTKNNCEYNSEGLSCDDDCGLIEDCNQDCGGSDLSCMENPQNVSGIYNYKTSRSYLNSICDGEATPTGFICSETETSYSNQVECLQNCPDNSCMPSFEDHLLTIGLMDDGIFHSFIWSETMSSFLDAFGFDDECIDDSDCVFYGQGIPTFEGVCGNNNKCYYFF